MGQPIKTSRIPPAFWVWYDDLKTKYPYRTMEIKGGEIAVCRVQIPVDGADAIENLPFGKMISDASGEYLERTFIPKYFASEDKVRSV